MTGTETGKGQLKTKKMSHTASVETVAVVYCGCTWTFILPYVPKPFFFRALCMIQCLFQSVQFYRGFPQKHSAELLTTIQAGCTLVYRHFPFISPLALFLSLLPLHLCSVGSCSLFHFCLPQKGLRNLLLQATLVDWKMFCSLGLGDVYYVRCVGEVGWYIAEAYLVLVSMALQ